MEIINKIIQARANLVLDECFFGTLALRLELKEDPTCKTFWTDGHYLAFNPAYVESLTLAECQGVVSHEILHVSNGHCWRRDGRDKKRWNLAADFAIDPVIVAARMRLPDGGHIDPSLDGLSAEEIYARQQPPPQGQTGNEGDRDFGCGEVRDCEDEDAATQEAEWQVAVIQAAQAAKAQGKLPAGIERLVEEIRRPKIDWRATLRRFVQTCAKRDFTWRRPNRRYVASGLYLPALQSEQMPPMAIYWDTSGSRDYEEARAECAAEIASIIEEVKPERTYVIYGDTQFQHADEFEPGDEIKFNPKGGGGTDFSWIPKYIEEQGIEPACLICITDGLGVYPTKEVCYPVIWVMTTDCEPPFGECIKIGI